MLLHEIEHLPLDSLKRNKRNARKHSKKQIRQLARVIERFGFNNLIQIDDADMILAGHARFEAAKMLGMPLVPCIRLKKMSEEEKRVYALADNKLALNASWDEEILAQEMNSLFDLKLDLDISLTGFSIIEIDGLVQGLSVVEPGDPADDVVPNAAPARCRPGDIWQLDRHRLLCGSALDSDVVASLMDGEKAKMVFTDPPYNVPIDGHVAKLWRHKTPRVRRGFWRDVGIRV